MTSGLLAGFSVVLGGVLVAAQGPIYARLSALVGGNPLAPAFLAFATATLVLGAALLAGQVRLPDARQLAALPWWVWLGGLFGAYQVMVSMQAVPVLGVTLFLMLVILGNMAGAAVFDHFGWFGLPRRPVDLKAVLGIALIFAGVLLTASRG
jgi:transporter family-2 protein